MVGKMTSAHTINTRKKIPGEKKKAP